MDEKEVHVDLQWWASYWVKVTKLLGMKLLEKSNKLLWSLLFKKSSNFKVTSYSDTKY